MKKRKNVVVPALILSAVMLSGCGQQGTSSVESSAAPESSATSSSDEASIVLSFPDSSDEKSSAEESSEEESSAEESSVEESTGGNNLTQGAEGVMTNGLLKMTDSTGHVWGISLYGGGSGDNYASYLNQFKKKVGDTVNVFNMVIPTQSAFYTPEEFADYNASHLNSINSIANQLDGVINVDAYSVLEAHTDEYIYTRTDHHWMPLGAYYAAKAFCETAQVDIKPLDTYKKYEVEGFVGSMYRFSDYDPDIENDPEVFTYYVPSTDHTATYYTTSFEEDYDSRFIKSIFVDQPVSGSYSIFMGGDEKIVKAETDNKNGRKLCVFKDSYGNAEIPFYIDGFEEIYVCDIRYFDNLKGSEFVKENGITDVLFTMCTFSAVGENAECIKTNHICE